VTSEELRRESSSSRLRDLSQRYSSYPRERDPSPFCLRLTALAEVPNTSVRIGSACLKSRFSSCVRRVGLSIEPTLDAVIITRPI
jgi:hypothetical protein